MKDKHLLFEVKALEKMIFRTFIEKNKPMINKKEYLPTPTQIQIMEYIVEHEDSVYQRDLEKVLSLRRATVSGVLQTMEKHELIKRIPDENDARSKKIIIHPKTKELFLNRRKEMTTIEKIVTKDISKEELVEFTNILNKMKMNIENYNKNNK